MFAVARQQPNRPKEWLTAWGMWTVNPTRAKTFDVTQYGFQPTDDVFLYVFLDMAPRSAVAVPKEAA